MAESGSLDLVAPGELRFFLSTPQESLLGQVFAGAERSLRIYIISVSLPVETVWPDQLAALLPENIAGIAIPDLPALVEAAAREAGFTLSALFCELLPENCFPPSPDEDLSAYCTMTVSSHGFPAGVLVRGTEFFMPGRSGLPLGVVGEPQYLIQNIDIEPDDSLYFHSHLAEPGLLRQMHGHLVKHELPPELMESMGVIRLHVE